MASVQFSIRMDPRIKSRLDQEAKLEDRSAAYIAQKAITQYIGAQEYKRRVIEEALVEADKGVFISEETVTAWFMSLGTENELPQPEPDIVPAPSSK